MLDVPVPGVVDGERDKAHLQALRTVQHERVPAHDSGPLSDSGECINTSTMHMSIAKSGRMVRLCKLRCHPPEAPVKSGRRVRFCLDCQPPETGVLQSVTELIPLDFIDSGP